MTGVCDGFETWSLRWLSGSCFFVHRDGTYIYIKLTGGWLRQDTYEWYQSSCPALVKKTNTCFSQNGFTKLHVRIHDSDWYKETFPKETERVYHKEELMENHLQPIKMSHLLLMSFFTHFFFSSTLNVWVGQSSATAVLLSSAHRTLSPAQETKASLFLWFLTYWRSEWNFT